MKALYIFNSLLVFSLSLIFISVANAERIKLSCHEMIDGAAFDYTVDIDEDSAQITHTSSDGAPSVTEALFSGNRVSYHITNELQWMSIVTAITIDTATLQAARVITTTQTGQPPKELPPKFGQCKFQDDPVEGFIDAPTPQAAESLTTAADGEAAIENRGELSYAGSAKVSNFRGSTWGDSRTEIIKLKGKPSPSKEGHFFYKNFVGPFSVLTNYEFVNGKLSQGQYILQEMHDDKNLYIEDYNVIKNMLTSKYGQPVIDDVLWENEEFKSNKKKWGDALAAGHLTYHSQWETNDTIIEHRLIGEGSTASHGVIYKSTLMLEAVKEERKKKILSDW